MTKLEKHKALKYQMDQEAEELDVLGQENDKSAAKWVIEKGKEHVHEVDEKRAETRWKLEDAKLKVWTYNEQLLNEAVRMILLSDVPAGYRYAAKLTKKGMEFWIRDVEGNWYAQGMTISGLPKYDLNGLDRNIEKGLDFIDKLELERTPPETEENGASSIITSSKL